MGTCNRIWGWKVSDAKKRTTKVSKFQFGLQKPYQFHYRNIVVSQRYAGFLCRSSKSSRIGDVYIVLSWQDLRVPKRSRDSLWAADQNRWPSIVDCRADFNKLTCVPNIYPNILIYACLSSCDHIWPPVLVSTSSLSFFPLLIVVSQRFPPVVPHAGSGHLTAQDLSVMAQTFWHLGTAEGEPCWGRWFDRFDEIDSSPLSQRQVIIFQGFPTACSRYFRTSRLEAEKSEARAFSRRVARLVSECLPQQIRPAGRANPFSCVLLLAGLGYETRSKYSKV